MRLIDADTAQPGLTITAMEQTQGKGQRGRKWADTHGYSLLMTIIVSPLQQLSEQFVFNAHVATAVADALQTLYEGLDIRIKWPNDIIVNDKKAGGILIENVIRGNKWVYAIIGTGLNIRQRAFPDELPYATSLKIASGNDYDITQIRDLLREKILDYTSRVMPEALVLKQYNEYLYRKGEVQSFINSSGEEWEAIIVHANADGTLQVQLPSGQITSYVHGAVTWNWK